MYASGDSSSREGLYIHLLFVTVTHPFRRIDNSYCFRHVIFWASSKFKIFIFLSALDLFLVNDFTSIALDVNFESVSVNDFTSIA